MSTIRRLAAASLFALTLAACDVSSTSNEAAPAEGGQIAAADKLARVEMNVDTAYLSAEEREGVNLLIQAAELMNPIYLRQVSAENPRIRAEIEKSGDAAMLAKFDQMMGPWDEVDEDKPFIGSAARPVGGGFYPADLTKEQFDRYLAANPGEAAAL